MMVKYRRSKRLARKQHKLLVINNEDNDFQEPMVKAIARFRRFQATGKLPIRRIKKMDDDQNLTARNKQTESMEDSIELSRSEKGETNSSSSDSESHVPMTPSTHHEHDDEEEEYELIDDSSDDE